MEIFLIMILGWIIISFLISLLTPTDSTDKDWSDRSGMRLHTDYKIGLQYLEGRNGGLHPRLGKNGLHMNIYDDRDDE